MFLTLLNFIRSMGMELLYLRAVVLLCAAVISQGYPSPCSEDLEHCTVGLCNISGCSVCTNHNAVCNTDSADQPVPQEIPKWTWNMILSYNGKTSIHLKQEMFNKFTHLENLTVSGNILSISPMAFSGLARLERLTITRTKIDSMPFDSFFDGAWLRFLVLTHNRFTEIPYRLFGKIKKLIHLDLSYNPLQICDGKSQTIGAEFSHLPNLFKVILAGVGDERCKTLPANFFAPMNQIRELDLSQSKLLIGSPKILLPLVHLSALFLDNLEPYKTCPAKIHTVFEHLPHSLTSLYARCWTSEFPLNRTCMLNKMTLAALKKTKISWIDFQDSDLIIGEVLKKDTFGELSSLRTLKLDGTRISSIERGALQNLTKLVTLSANGNQLGPRRFWLCDRVNMSRLLSLSLNNIGILHNDHQPYNVAHILQEFPQLREIFLDSNHFTMLPSLITGSQTYENMLKLSFNDNGLKALSSKEMAIVCRAMPNLSYFSAKHNSITDITGLCTTLEKLYLEDNSLGGLDLLQEEANLNKIKKMHRLRQLSVNNNGITKLPDDLVQDMANLTIFLASDNAITSIPTHFFKFNLHLSHIDFSLNLITSLDVQHFSHSTRLRYIIFHGNQLTTVSQPVREKLDNISHYILRNEPVPLLHVFDVNANPFDCYCGDEDQPLLQTWLRSAPYVANVKNLTCAGYDHHRTGDLVYSYSQDPLYCIYRIPLFIALAIALTFAFVVPVVVKLYKYRWYIRNPKVVARAISASLHTVQNEQTCQYDAVVSYDKNCDEDIKFIQEHLIPEIEGDSRYQTVPEGPTESLESTDNYVSSSTEQVKTCL